MTVLMEDIKGELNKTNNNITSLNEKFDQNSQQMAEMEGKIDKNSKTCLLYTSVDWYSLICVYYYWRPEVE